MPIAGDNLDGTLLTGEQQRLSREARRAGLHVRHALTPAESETLSDELDRFDELSSREQAEELEQPDSPWQDYLWEYDGFGLTILGRVAPLRAPTSLPLVRTPLRVRPRARAVRPRRRRTTGGSRDRPRPSADDDEADPARRALARLAGVLSREAA
jgi:hypothetical protein